ncbi:hypothetical protein D3C77_458980 [compost metagenome]
MVRLAAEILASGIQFDQFHPCLACFVQVAVQTIEMTCIDDRGVVLVVPECGVKCGNHFFYRRNERLLQLLGHEYIVRRQTDLTGVMQFSGHDFADRRFQIGGAGNDGGRLATQLQCHGYQIFGSGAHYVFANAAGTREHQMVKGLLCERLPDVRTAGNDCDFVLGID